MKKILVALMLVLALSLGGCNIVDETLVEKYQDRGIQAKVSLTWLYGGYGL